MFFCCSNINQPEKSVSAYVIIMASAVGKTVEGTDGSDHLFREKVASQYKIRYRKKLIL